MAEKKWIYTQIQSLDKSIFEGSIPEITERLNALRLRYTVLGWRGIKIKVEVWYDSTEFILEGERLETDKEMARRLKDAERKRKRNKADKAAKEEREKKELVSLIEKYGNPDDWVGI